MDFAASHVCLPDVIFKVWPVPFEVKVEPCMAHFWRDHDHAEACKLRQRMTFPRLNLILEILSVWVWNRDGLLPLQQPEFETSKQDLKRLRTSRGPLLYIYTLPDVKRNA